MYVFRKPAVLYFFGVWKYVLLQVRMFKHGPSFKSRNPQLGNRDRFENLNSQSQVMTTDNSLVTPLQVKRRVLDLLKSEK